MRGKGTGDVLARGAVRASYLTTEQNVTKEKWNDIFADFDNEAYQKKEVVKDENALKEVATTGRR